jgi:ABC-type multidrug transport system fused ATPase/permease subunit
MHLFLEKTKRLMLSKWSRAIEHSLFSFIWKHSKRQQLLLLLVTAALFPLLYLTLELPKRIINDAIGAGSDTVIVLNTEIGQITYLAILCLAFLGSVLVHGVLKMRINTMTGIVAERMLRRLRYNLITRIFRFPKSYFQRTSQAEIVSMITAESEPLGGMMGNALSQPLLQAGQMLTILGFLFAQSFWFGLASVALIPLQAWVIPKLQKRINRLNKIRVSEVRKLAAEIGETAAGTDTLRTSGGWSYRSAMITNRLGVLYNIRLDIFRKKFFMKFLNNFITQLTPFFLFSIGGYLVLQGTVSLGALVAALAAYKDLSSPWKELLAYYNQAHEMSQRWTLITDQFAPASILGEELFTNPPEDIPNLNGDIVFNNVSAKDIDGLTVLDNVSLLFPAGSLVAIAAPNQEDRRVISELLTRELLPSNGSIILAGHPLTSLHQSVIAARVGYADSRPYLYAGTIGENVSMSLNSRPRKRISNAGDDLPAERTRAEAIASGNAQYMVQDDWLDPSLAGLENFQEVQDWWLKMVEGMGAGETFLRRGLGLRTNEKVESKLAKSIAELRPEIKSQLKSAGLVNYVHPFGIDQYNPSVGILENLFYAISPTKVTQTQLQADPAFLSILQDTQLTNDVLGLAHKVVDLLHQTFGKDGTSHPLFIRLGIESVAFENNRLVSQRIRDAGVSKIPTPELALLLALPCVVSADQIGSIFENDLKKRIIDLRVSHAEILKDRMIETYHRLDSSQYADGLTVLENALFGKFAGENPARADQIREIVANTLKDNNLKRDVSALTYGEPTNLGGTNLPADIAEGIAFTRACLKRPNILVLNKILSSFDDDIRFAASILLREEMPTATIIYLEDSFRHPENFDVYIEMQNGRINTTAHQTSETTTLESKDPDIAIKLRTLEENTFFTNLDRKQMRILAFASQWYSAVPGETVFNKNDDGSDGAYLIIEGEADLVLPLENGEERLIRTMGPGSLIGELALILGEPRSLSMKAKTDLRALRIGSQEFLAVVKDDAQTAFKMLQVLAHYLSKPVQ